jgi:hypothetical protein
LGKNVGYCTLARWFCLKKVILHKRNDCRKKWLKKVNTDAKLLMDRNDRNVTRWL